MSKIIKLRNKFNKRWNVNEDINYEEEFRLFKSFIVRGFQFIDSFLEYDDLIEFIKYSKMETDLPIVLEIKANRTRYVQAILESEKKEVLFYRHIEVLFSLDFKQGTKSSYLDILKDGMKYYDINLVSSQVNDEIILFPKGESEFDDKLVNEALIFLNNESQLHFIESLKFYQTKNLRNYIKAAESLRRSLEEFLRYKLKNDKGLDANILELQTIMKKDKRDPIIRKNIIYTTFSFLDSYFNENSKHKDGDIDEAECEYLIYQTGVLMRYINKVSV